MKKSNEERARELLKKHRVTIDAIDAEILKQVGARLKIVRDVAKIKKKHDIPAYLPARVEEVRENAAKVGKKYGIDENFTRALYSLMIFHACSLEDDLRK